MSVLEELLAVRNLQPPGEAISIQGSDPVLSTRYPLGQVSTDVMTAIGIAVNDLWELKTGRRQALSVNLAQAAAALRSYSYMSVADSSATASTPVRRAGISSPHPTRDGRYFLPHMGLPHLADRVLKVLGCDNDHDAVVSAVACWDALDLENAIAEAQACGAMVRSADE